MRTIRILPTLALMAAMAGCATGPAVHVDRDPAANFSSYKTFAFFDPVATDRTRYSTLMTAHLKQATRAQMEKFGYVYDEASPDLRINFYVNVADRQELRSGSYGGFHGYRAGLYHGWGGYPYKLETVNYKAGTLSVDLVAVNTKALIWQGVAEGRVGDKAMRDPVATVDSAVSEIFRNFPSIAHL